MHSTLDTHVRRVRSHVGTWWAYPRMWRLVTATEQMTDIDVKDIVVMRYTPAKEHQTSYRCHVVKKAVKIR